MTSVSIAKVFDSQFVLPFTVADTFHILCYFSQFIHG